MATDGVKIIDGDLAHDTYEYIMECMIVEQVLK